MEFCDLQRDCKRLGVVARRILVSLLFAVGFCLLLFFSRGVLQWLVQLFTLGILSGLSVVALMSLMKNRTPIITRYALLMGADDTPEERSYTRKVTWGWALFFVILLGLKWIAILGGTQTEGVGLVELFFYIGSVILFVGEFYIRQLCLPAHRGSSLWLFLTQLSQISPKQVWQFDHKQ